MFRTRIRTGSKLLRHITEKFQSRIETRTVPPLHFRKDMECIRKGDWKAAPTPAPLQCRHVELTGPGNDAKMVINAMNSKADGYMFDLEDSMAPTRFNVQRAHHNLRQLVAGTLCHSTADRTYRIESTRPPTLSVRVRGLHMKQGGVSAMLYDICEFMEHSAWPLLESGRGPFLYIPKLETYEDSLFVDDVLSECEKQLSLPHGSTKTTVLIETFPSIFQTDEIIYAQKDRLVGLNCGRWDYLFSMIKYNPDILFPDREQLSMDKRFLKEYVLEIVNTCHKRDVHAMGGMSAFIPTPGRDIAETLRRDKILELQRGCDGAWVAHPGMIEQVQGIFRSGLNGASHQKHRRPSLATRRTFLEVSGTVTKQSFESNVKASLFYLDAWLQGHGAVAYNGMMEDLATFEIAAQQLNNWCAHGAALAPTGTVVTTQLLFSSIDNENYPDKTSNLLKKYVTGNYNFLGDVVVP
jgi:malate synthase